MSMKMITDVTIDLYGEIQYYMASAKQGDKATRYLRVQLMNNGNEFQIPDDVILIANIKKPDGKFCYNECERENNRVMVQLTSQALAAAGTAYCDIEMRDSDDKLILSSAAFSIEIEKSMRNEDAIESCNEITFLEKKVQQYIDSMLEVRKQVLSTEEAFKIAEAARVLAENGRVDAENIRQENEIKRVTAEEVRQEQLLKMQEATETATTAANRAETAADTAEKTEETVKTAERARVLAENGRVDAENIRQENEIKRVTAEEARQEHLNNKSNPHNVTKAQVGLGNVNNTADVNKPVSTAQQNAIDSAYQQATGYTDQKIADLISGAPETLDTLKEVADAIQANKDVSTALDAAIGKKANQTELDTHTGNNTIHITSTERTNWNAAKTHADSAHARTDATKTEKSNTNGNIKINGTETSVYTHPNTAGNKHIPSGGSSGQILRWSADGTAVWDADNDTKVTQTNTTANADTRLLLSGNANSTTETNTAKKSDNFLANPAKGDFFAKGYRRIDITGATLDINTLTLSKGYPNIVRYIERTDGGSSKITNIPVAGHPFLLDVEMIRWNSTTDYITMQTFRNASDYTHEYVRICTNGTWSAWQKRVFTDNNTTYGTATQSANGLLSAADKKKIDGIAAEANKTVVDTALSDSSTNPVQNKVVKSVLDKKLSATGAYVSSQNTSNYPWHRIAYAETSAGTFTDKDAIIVIKAGYTGGSFGILKVSTRANGSGQAGSCTIEWIVRKGYSVDAVRAGFHNVSGDVYADLFLYVGPYARTDVTLLCGLGGSGWVVCASIESTNGQKGENVYSGIESAATEIRGKAYSAIVVAQDSTIVNYANSAGSVAWSNVTGKPGSFTPSNHTHTKSQITDFPSALKNPNAITFNVGEKIQSGGKVLMEGGIAFTYDGSAAVSIDLTAAAIGASRIDHTHNYLSDDLTVRRVRRVTSGTTITILVPFVSGGGQTVPTDDIRLYLAVAGIGVSRGTLKGGTALSITWDNTQVFSGASISAATSSSGSTYSIKLTRSSGFNNQFFMQAEYTHGISDVAVS